MLLIKMTFEEFCEVARVEIGKRIKGVDMDSPLEFKVSSSYDGDRSIVELPDYVEIPLLKEVNTKSKPKPLKKWLGK